MSNGLPCEECGRPTYMHCHVDGVPTTCRDCDERRTDEARKNRDRGDSPFPRTAA